MHIVLLKFSANKSQASQHMEGHKKWIQQGFSDGVFLLAGTLKPEAGGAILVHNIELAALRERLSEDPFVAHDVVQPEIHELAPARADERLAFLVD